MKRILSLVYVNELRRFVFALFLGWLLTNLFYHFANTMIDSSLKANLEAESENLKRLSYYHSAQREAKDFNDYESILDQNRVVKPEVIDHYFDMFLYGGSSSDETIGWSSYRSTILFPYMSKTTFSGGDIVDFMMGFESETNSYRERKFETLSSYDSKRQGIKETEEERKDANMDAKAFKEEVQKDLSYAIQPLISAVQESTAYKLRRYLNGFIQFLTIWLTFTGIIIVLAFHLLPAIRSKKELDYIFQSKHEQEMKKRALANHKESTKATLMSYRLMGIVTNFFRVKASKGLEQAQDELRNGAEEIRMEQESSGGITRYLIWVIPSIGFIGTVIGIAQALENSHKVISDGGQLQQQAAVQDITSYLGVAFDTTLIALFASILLYFLVQVTIRYEEAFIADSLGRIAVLSGEDDVIKLHHESDWAQLLETINDRLSVEDLKTPEVAAFVAYCKKRLKQ